MPGRMRAYWRRTGHHPKMSRPHGRWFSLTMGVSLLLGLTLGIRPTVGACGEEVENSPPFDPNGGDPGGDVDPLTPRASDPPEAIDETSIVVSVWRNGSDEGGLSGCQVAPRCATPAASFQVVFDAPADDETAAQDLGYEFDIVEGEVPSSDFFGNGSTAWVYAPGNAISFSLWDTPDPFSFTLTPIDEDGNRGPTTSPIEASL